MPFHPSPPGLPLQLLSGCADAGGGKTSSLLCMKQRHCGNVHVPIYEESTTLRSPPQPPATASSFHSISRELLLLLWSDPETNERQEEMQEWEDVHKVAVNG